MAYFLPSYFQKRLLRYALGRLDFIDSDALDLDNLGFTVGQRSVIELKNVGLRVSKLAERLEIPSTVHPRHASIRTLRVVIPADLHVSGIEVEVDGIDVEINVDQTRAQGDAKQPNIRGGTAPDHNDVANRPRIASTAVHDPGGVQGVRKRNGPESSHILPAPEDLAASYLETEPEQEKQELQAAVESRSVHLQQSSSDLDLSTTEDGTGMPEGFSLPGFVTNFFTGIADRLSVSIRHVAVKLSLLMDKDGAPPEPFDYVLTIEEIALESLKPSMAAGLEADPRRAIRVLGVELLVVSDELVFASRSATSSPRLAKNRSATSPSSLRKPATESSVSPSFHSSYPSSIASSSARIGLGVDQSMLETSQLFHPSVRHSDDASASPSPEFYRLSPVHSRDNSTGTDRTPSPVLLASQRSQSQRSFDDDLAESRVFSHDEAESMYMSAFSNNLGASERAPEVFHRPIENTSDSSSGQRAASSTTTGVAEDTAAASENSTNPSWAEQLESSVESSGAQRTPQPEREQTSSPTRCTKRIIRLNDATIRIPKRAADNAASERQLTSEPTQTPAGRDARVFGASAASAYHSRTLSNQSVYGIPKDYSMKIEEYLSYEVSIGHVEASVDTILCYLLVKSGSQVSSIFDQPGQVSKSTNGKKTELHFKASVQSIVLNVMENVSDLSTAAEQCPPTESTFSMRGEDAPLLQLQILKIQLQMLLQDGKLDQRLAIHRLGLYHENDKIVSFFDPSAVQESFVASSSLLEPDDIVVIQSDNRVDVSIKPMHVMLDLLLLDDVLSRSGGLSSLLDLGNSVTSAKTAKHSKKRSNSTLTRRRSVHFDEPAPRSGTHGDNDDVLKLNLRISGSIIDLVGSQSSVQIKSSAFKLVYRPSKMRASISSISIKGPIMRGTSAGDTLILKLGDLQLLYLETPEEEDLDRLLHLLVPSSDKYEQDDDIMVDTLLRQRRKGGVVRLSVQDVQVTASGVSWTQQLGKLGEEISKLSTVTKYLPEDDRPGILVFALLTKFTARIDLNKTFGPLIIRTNLLEGALISIPSLMAAQISSINVSRGQIDSIIHDLVPNMQESIIMGPPVFMCRFIPDEMEPTIKLKLSNACFEYSVPLLLAITQLVESLQRDLVQDSRSLSPRASEVSSNLSEASDLARKIKLSLSLRNSAISLKPLGSPACGLFVFTDAVIGYSSKHGTVLTNLEISKASLMVVDDVSRIGQDVGVSDARMYFDQNDQIQELVKSGFVPVGTISAASADVKIEEDSVTKKQFIDVEFRNKLLFLETCADSTQSLIQILGGLSPPAIPSKEEKYRTEIVPLQDMLASWTGDAFIAEKGPEMGLRFDRGNTTPTPSTAFAPQAQTELSQILVTDDDDDGALMNDLYMSQTDDYEHGELTQSGGSSRSAHSNIGGTSIHIAPVSMTADDEVPLAGSVMMHSLIDFRDGHFMQNSTSVGGTAHRWNSTRNTYGMGSETSAQRSPLKVRIRDVHIIWNLFDGYDWQNTRDVITLAVREVEEKAFAKQRRRESHRSPGPDDEDESVVGDVLFNSIYISIPTNRDPRDLTNAINMELGDGASETGSYATSTTITAATSKRHSAPRYRPKRLKLNRSKSHKITFELQGLSADFFAFPPGAGEVESSVDVRVQTVEVFDNIPTSTWRKFATYMHEAGEREHGTDMVHIELLNVKPIAELAASEMVLKVTVLPLRLHVDQDALEFMTRFFDFKDTRAPPSSAPSIPPFIQRAEVNPIKLRLDFKPKRVDYAGLKSGKLTEFMNFIILDRADIVLRRVILYGVSGFDRLGIMLNNIWTPDVRNNQLPTVLAGLAPVRSLVDVGSGVRDLIAIPIQEYKKDGRIVRSIQKGALAFAKTTTTELVNLGAKLAIGTQTVLQGAEDVLAPQNKQQSGIMSDSDDDDQHKQISHYADQPLGIIQGLRGAYASLERDLLLAKDAIVAVPGEIMAEGSATGAAKVVLKQSPTIILRPAIGVTKAMGQVFLGAGNTLDKGNRRRTEDKYKRY